MDNIKVYLQSPWKKGGECSYYKYLREGLPSNIKYLNKESSQIIQNKNKNRLNHFIKRTIRKAITIFYPSMPNAHYTKNARQYGLIHCAHCLSKNKQPWICDIEFVGQFWAGGYFGKYPSKKRVLKYLESPYCKKIMAWTDWCAKEIIKEFPEIREKVEVVYPAMPLPKFKKINTGKIRLLFVSRLFYFKGGLYAIEVMDRLTKKYKNVEGVIISDIPKEVIEKYRGNKKIKILSMVKQSELFRKTYPSSDIFLYPSATDTFGFGLIEGMSFGLPVVAIDGLSRKEVVVDSKTGYVIDRGDIDFNNPEVRGRLEGSEKIIDSLCEKASLLIEDKKLRDSMSREGVKAVKDGKFSIKERNKKLSRIYFESIE